MNVLMAAVMVGVIASQAPDVPKALEATERVYRMLMAPAITDVLEAGTCTEPIMGRVEFSNVRFAYPSRPSAPVLNGFSLSIPAGQTVALVGASGCGKSTVVALLQRFYDLNGQTAHHGGHILLDGRMLADYELDALRSQVLVDQHMWLLFFHSIRDPCVIMSARCLILFALLCTWLDCGGESRAAAVVYLNSR